MSKTHLFTSESVADGHPDKLADQISDAVLDLYLSRDPNSRVACETMVTTNYILIAGEVRSAANITPEEVASLARHVAEVVGYDQAGFSHKTAEVHVKLHAQSADIAVGVDAAEGGKDEGAGDQGLMFGYACDETPSFMPAALHYANSILAQLQQVRNTTKVDVNYGRIDEPGTGVAYDSHGYSNNDLLLGPDAKSQVTLKYVDGKIVAIDTIVVSTQHHEHALQEQVRDVVYAAIEAAGIPEDLLADWKLNGKFYCNPTGIFVIGGPDGDTGLTGRKIIVDTYGGAAPHGGGAFSGKDPSKVDRSAAYAARYLAKNVVAAGLATKCTIQLAYAIGVSRPVSVSVDTHGTGRITDAEIAAALEGLVDLSPRGIRTHLHLNRPIYFPSASYGHFGREYNPNTGAFSWENTDLTAELSKLVAQ